MQRCVAKVLVSGTALAAGVFVAAVMQQRAELCRHWEWHLWCGETRD